MDKYSADDRAEQGMTVALAGVTTGVTATCHTKSFHFADDIISGLVNLSCALMNGDVSANLRKSSCMPPLPTAS